MTWQQLPQVRAAQRRTLTLLSVAQVLGGIGTGAGFSVGILIAEQVTSSAGWAGVARTGTTVGAALISVPLAVVAMRRGRRVSLGGGWLVSAAGSVLMVLAAQLAGAGSMNHDGHPMGPPVSGQVAVVATLALVVGMTAAGAGSAVGLQMRYAATDLAEPTHAGRHLSLVVWATTVGSVLGPNLGVPGEGLSRLLGMAPLAGPFVIAAVVQFLAAIAVLAMRPDPLLLAQQHTGLDARRKRPPLWRSLKLAWGIGPARFALVAMSAAHTVMVGVMTMTPVHLDHHGATVTVVGITVSLHVLGMYALSPVVGTLADRFGPVAMAATGAIVLLAATAIAGFGSNSVVWVTVGLTMIGLGWCLCTVSAAAALTRSVSVDRTTVQGAADAMMNFSAAIGAGLSGPLLGIIGFGGLNVIAAAMVLIAVPIAVSGLRRPTPTPELR